MKLEKTVDLMLSEDYWERYQAEYHQTVYRRNQLRKAIKEMESGDEKGRKNVADHIVMAKWQLRVMDDYIYVLKARAELDGIPLK